MTDRPSELFLWLDLETTGLDPELDEIVEVGAILTTADLDEIAHWMDLVTPTTLALIRMMRDATVRQMHDESGLLDDLATCGWCPPEGVEHGLLGWLDAHAGPDTRVILAGNNVDAFDRQFLAKWMPALAGRLHYHGHDVGAHLTTYRQAGDPLVWSPGRAHRALDDARAALEVERQVRARLAKRSGLAALVEQADQLTAHFEREAWAEPPEPSYIYRDHLDIDEWAAMLAHTVKTGDKTGRRVEVQSWTNPPVWVDSVMSRTQEQFKRQLLDPGNTYRIVEGGDRS